MKAVGVSASIDSVYTPHASISTVAADKSFLRLRFCRRWPDFLIPHPASCCLLGWLAVFLCLHAHERVCIFLLALPARPGGVRSLRSAPGLVLVPLPVTLACASLSSLLWASHVDPAGGVKSKKRINPAAEDSTDSSHPSFLYTNELVVLMGPRGLKPLSSHGIRKKRTTL